MIFRNNGTENKNVNTNRRNAMKKAITTVVAVVMAVVITLVGANSANAVCRVDNTLQSKVSDHQSALVAQKQKCATNNPDMNVFGAIGLDAALSSAGCTWEDIGLPKVVTKEDLCGGGGGQANNSSAKTGLVYNPTALALVKVREASKTFAALIDFYLDVLSDTLPGNIGRKKEWDTNKEAIVAALVGNPRQRNAIKAWLDRQKASKPDKFEKSKSGQVLALLAKVLDDVYDVFSSGYLSSAVRLDKDRKTMMEEAKHLLKDENNALLKVPCTISNPNAMETALEAVSVKLQAVTDGKDANALKAVLTALRAVPAPAWNCNNKEQTYVTEAQKVSVKLTGEVKATFDQYLAKGMAATKPDDKLMYIWAALGSLPLDQLAKHWLGEQGLIILGGGGGGRWSIAGKDRVLNKNTWVPPIGVRISGGGGAGEGSDSLYEKHQAVYSKTADFAVNLSVDFAWKFHRHIALIGSPGVFLGYRKTEFRDQRAPDGKWVTNDNFTVGALGRLGLNFADWVSLYGTVRGRFLPLGIAAGGGAEITGLGWFRAGVEALYDFTRDQSGTGSGYNSETPANHSGWSVLFSLGFLL